jgi:integrase
MPILKARPPKYCPYREGARVSIQGHTHYLPGKFNSDESLAEYRRLVAQWGAGMVIDAPAEDQTTISVAEVLEGYRVFAQAYYGEARDSRYGLLLSTIRTVREVYSDLPASEFGPKALKTLRQVFVQAGYTRGHVNVCVQRVVTVFRWACSEELVDGSLVHALESVQPLRRGHTEAPEGKIVHAVPQATVDATLPFLTSVLADMVQLQLVTGCRPGEVCSLTPDQVDRTGDVWLYRPVQHKTEHLGHDRTIAIGPRGQDILRKYLLRPGDRPCFSPRESLAQHMDEAHEKRVTPLSCGHKPRPGGRKRRIAAVGDSYTVASYRRAVERACARRLVSMACRPT